jgi:hypothetical protein
MSLSDYLAKTRTPDETADAAAAAMPSRDIAPRASENTGEAGLLLLCHDRRAWGFPWSYYIESLLVPAGAASVAGTGVADEAHDILTVVFASREVILRGRNLASLHEAIVRHCVREIHETPERFLPAPGLPGNVPLVVEITVRVRGK